MRPDQQFKREVKTRPLTIKERQDLLDMGMIPYIIDDESPSGRLPTIEDLASMTKVIAARDIITGKWYYYE